MACIVCGGDSSLPLCDTCKSDQRIVMSILGYLLTHPGESDYRNQPAFQEMLTKLRDPDN